LTARQQNFVDDVVSGMSFTDAYRKNYDCSRMLAVTVNRKGAELAKIPHIAEEMARLRAEASERAVRTVADVTNEFLRVAFADPGKIVQHRRLNCRYCFGVNHAYQWKNEAEFNRAVQVWEIDEQARREAKGKKQRPAPMPTDEGGYGFAFNLSPHPACPACLGEGHADVFVADTTKLSPEDRRLIERVKVTKDGIEIRFRNQQDALTKAGQMLGGFKSTVILQNPDGTPIAQAPNVVNLTPDEAAAAYRAWIEGKE
jgi:phage terminase small subunit